VSIRLPSLCSIKIDHPFVPTCLLAERRAQRQSRMPPLNAAASAEPAQSVLDRASTVELAALPKADPARQIGSGPVLWRRLVPRVAPLMIIYFYQGWTGWLFVTWMPSLSGRRKSG
jgi:hypothetical protein